jgi:hypothetical protein
VERRGDVDNEDVVVDADNVADRSIVIRDEAVDAAVDETTVPDVLGGRANGSGN